MDLLLYICDFAVKVLQDLLEGNLLQLLLGDLTALLLERALRIIEEGLNLRESEVGVALARALPLLYEPNKRIIDQQTPESILHILLLQLGQVEPKDLDEFNLGLDLKFPHECHGQILKLPNHIISDLLLPLEDLNKAIKILMQAQWKSSFLIKFIVSFLLIIIPLKDWLEVDIILDLLLEPRVALLIIDGQLA